METRYLGPKVGECVGTLHVCSRDSAKGGRGSSSVFEDSGAFGRATKATDSDTRTTTDEDSASSSAAIVIDHAFDGNISGERSTLHRRMQRKRGPRLWTLQPTVYSFQAHLMRKAPSGSWMDGLPRTIHPSDRRKTSLQSEWLSQMHPREIISQVRLIANTFNCM